MKLQERIQEQPLLWFYMTSVSIVVVTIPVFIATHAQEGLLQGFEKSGLAFNTDLVTAFRVVWAAPEAFWGVLLSIISLASVDIAVFLIAHMAYGPAGLAELRHRFRFCQKQISRRRAAIVWGSCILTFSAMNFATGMLHSLTLPSQDFVWRLDLLSRSFWIGLVIAMALDVGALFEENGWRGFALPLLQGRLHPLNASVVLGMMWFGWHIPVKFDIFFYGMRNALVLFALLLVKFVLLSIIMTFFFNQVGGTTLIAIAMHGLSNDSVRIAGEIVGDSVRTYVLSEINLVIPMLMVAIALLYGTGGQLGFQKGCASPLAQPRVNRPRLL